METLTKEGLTAADLQLLHDITTEDPELRKITVTAREFDLSKLALNGWIACWVGQEETDYALTPKGTALLEEINALFVKPKKQKVVIDIPMDKVTQFNELAPAIKGGSGKYLRCNIKEVIAAFQWLFKNYPDHNNWEIILKAGELYWNEQIQENYKYARRVKYFVRKQMQDKSFESDLIEYYDRIVSGNVEDTNTNHFEERVV